MYTIKQAAARSGVTVQLLRAWERRYGVIAPGRTASGYRLYGEPDIARLRAMRRLINEGWAPSTAAGRIRELDDAAVDLLVVDPAETSGDTARAESAEDLAGSFVGAAAAIDEPSVEHALDQMFARGSFERVMAEQLMPALVALGDGWASGRVSVAGEHTASAAVQRRLGMAYMAAGGAPAQGDRDRVLIGLPPGGRHDLGALAFATAARRGGFAVRYLGADLPVADWLTAIKYGPTGAAVIGVPTDEDVPAATEVGRTLRSADDRLLIAFGGGSAGLISTDEVQPAIVLAHDLPTAVRQLADGIRAAARSQRAPAKL